MEFFGWTREGDNLVVSVCCRKCGVQKEVNSPIPGKDALSFSTLEFIAGEAARNASCKCPKLIVCVELKVINSE